MIINTIEIYKELGKKIESVINEPVYANIDKKYIKKPPPKAKTQYGPDGSAITTDIESGKVINVRPPSPKMQMMDMLEEKRPAKGEMKRSEKITKNFSYGEFKCKDKNRTQVPDEFKPNVETLAKILEKIRTQIGNKGISITSAYRTEEYNSSIGGAKDSQHLTAKAVDFRASGMSAHELYLNVLYLINTKGIPDGGLGYYDNFVHYDIRGSTARWVDKKYKGSDKGKAKLEALAKECNQKFEDAKILQIKPEGADEGREKDGEGSPISSYIIAAPAAAAAAKQAPTSCEGADWITTSSHIKSALSFVVKGGKYCDFGNTYGASRDRTFYSDIYSVLNNANVGSAPRDYMAREVEISRSIKKQIWRNFESTHARLRKSPAIEDTFQDAKSAIFRSTSVIYGIDVGKLESKDWSDRSNKNNVFNIGYVHHKNGKKPFIYASNTETWSRADGLKKLSKNVKAIIDKDVAFNNFKATQQRLVRALDSLKARLEGYIKFLRQNAFKFNNNPKRRAAMTKVIELAEKLVLVINRFNNNLQSFLSEEPTNEKIQNLMGTGYIISSLGVAADRSS